MVKDQLTVKLAIFLVIGKTNDKYMIITDLKWMTKTADFACFPIDSSNLFKCSQLALYSDFWLNWAATAQFIVERCKHTPSLSLITS